MRPWFPPFRTERERMGHPATGREVVERPRNRVLGRRMQIRYVRYNRAEGAKELGLSFYNQFRPILFGKSRNCANWKSQVTGKFVNPTSCSIAGPTYAKGINSFTTTPAAYT